MDDLRDLYEEVILDHNRHPRNYPRRPEGANRSAHGFNPLCGDDVALHLKIEDGVVIDAGFEGSGCAISTASASLLTEAIKGKTEADVEALFNEMHTMLTDGGDASDAIGKLTVLSGVKEYPMRVKCATLAWHTLYAALTQSKNSVTTE